MTIHDSKLTNLVELHRQWKALLKPLEDAEADVTDAATFSDGGKRLLEEHCSAISLQVHRLVAAIREAPVQGFADLAAKFDVALYHNYDPPTSSDDFEAFRSLMTAFEHIAPEIPLHAREALREALAHEDRGHLALVA